MPESVAEDRERARVATGDELATLLHHPSADVLLALLDNPALDEPQVCLLLERKDLPAEVLTVVLDNPYLTEAQILKTLSREKLPAGVVPAIIHHRKWSISYNIRIALLRQPSAPLAAILSYLPQLTVSDLRELAAPGIVPETLRRYIQAEVQRRLGAGASSGSPVSNKK